MYMHVFQHKNNDMYHERLTVVLLVLDSRRVEAEAAAATPDVHLWLLVLLPSVANKRVASNPSAFPRTAVCHPLIPLPPPLRGSAT